MDIVDDINKYYKEQKDKLNDKIVGKIDKLIFDNDRVTINNITCRYDVLGYYNQTVSTWTWGWANIFIEKNLVITQKQLLDVIPKLKTSKYHKEADKIILMISIPVFYIHQDNLPMLLKIIGYIGKYIGIVSHINMQMDKIHEYIGVKSINNIN